MDQYISQVKEGIITTKPPAFFLVAGMRIVAGAEREGGGLVGYLKVYSEMGIDFDLI